MELVANLLTASKRELAKPWESSNATLVEEQFLKVMEKITKS